MEESDHNLSSVSETVSDEDSSAKNNSMTMSMSTVQPIGSSTIQSPSQLKKHKFIRQPNLSFTEQMNR